MNRSLTWLWVLACILGNRNSFGQEPYVRTYTTQDGLVTNRVYCAFQDSEGFLWFGTEDGVSRFDGYTFENFRLTDGVTSLPVERIFEDSKHRLWFLSIENGLSYYKDRKFHNPSNHALLASLSEHRGFYSIMEDDSNNLWMGCMDGAILNLKSNNSVRWYSLPDSKTPPVFIDFYLASNNELWIISHSRFYKLDEDEFIPLIGPRIRSSRELGYYFISKGNALYWSDKGLERLINSNYGIIIPDKKIPPINLSASLYYSPQNDIWISDKKGTAGVFNYSNGNYDPFRKLPDGLRVNSFYTDNENNTWVCTNGSGVRCYRSFFLTFPVLLLKNGFKEPEPRALCADGDSMIWIASEDDLLQFSNNDAVQTIKLPVDVNNPLKDLLADRSGNVWAGSREKIFFTRKINAAHYAPPVAFDLNKAGIMKKTSNLVPLQNGAMAFASGVKLFSLRFQGGKFEFQKEDSILENTPIRFIHPLPDGSLVLVSSNGIYLKNSIGTNRLAADSIFSEITGLHFSPDSTIILSTRGQGLMCYHSGKRSRQILSVNGKDVSIVSGLAADSIFVYAGTASGICKINVEDDQATAGELLTVTDGLPSNSVLALCITARRLMAATPEGIASFPLPIVLKPDAPPALHLTYIRNGQHTIYEFDSLRFEHKNTGLVFGYTAPVFNDVDEVRFQYKITGYLENWTETSDRHVEITNMDPGSYIFQLRARRSNSDWSKPVIAKFEIITPFYGTLLFRLLIANTLIFLFYLLLRDFFSRKYRRQLALYQRKQDLENERNRISTDMHDDLGADLTNIVILSKIAKRTIAAGSKEEEAINKIQVASNDVINKMNEIIWALNPSNDSLYNLVSYIHGYTNDFLEFHHIAHRISIPPVTPVFTVKAALRRNIFLVVKEMLHNIVKHADATDVKMQIAIDKTTKKISITIDDNGKGFSVEERTGTGNGLLNIKRRMKEVNGDIEIVSEPGRGTHVSLFALYDK